MSTMSASSAERKPEVTRAVGSARDSSAEVPDGLDWQRFRAAYFPGSRPHNFEAIVAYGAHRRSLDAGGQHVSEPVENTDAHAIDAPSVEDWEDEGGRSHEPRR